MPEPAAHTIDLRTTATGFRASCSCGWLGDKHTSALDAATDAWRSHRRLFTPPEPHDRGPDGDDYPDQPGDDEADLEADRYESWLDSLNP